MCKSEIVDECSVVYVLFRCIQHEAHEARQKHYAMEEALLAILGQRSAHSLATGPVMADLGEQRLVRSVDRLSDTHPFISPLLLTITPALSSK